MYIFNSLHVLTHMHSHNIIILTPICIISQLCQVYPPLPSLPSKQVANSFDQRLIHPFIASNSSYQFRTQPFTSDFARSLLNYNLFDRVNIFCVLPIWCRIIRGSAIRIRIQNRSRSIHFYTNKSTKAGHEHQHIMRQSA
jgi:hypothetical protein